MSDDRWVVLGLAHPRARWFSELARWSTAAAIPVDFIKCVSPDEVRARLVGGRAYSALLVGGDLTGLDRDLVDSVRAVGASVIVVDPVVDRDWHELGVAGQLPATFDRADLVGVLSEHATAIPRVAAFTDDAPVEPEPRWRGRLIAVTGAGGTGVSITTMAVAQAFAAEPSNRAMVLLADFALDAEQAMLHDAREVIPGVQELTDAHRAGRLPIDQIRSLVFDSVDRGYHLLLGLRCHRDWTAIRPRAFEASLDGLLRSYRLVIADIDRDFENQSETGSLDVEDRNLMARTTATRADLVVAVGQPSTKGIHSLSRVIRQLIGAGVDTERIVPVLNRAPRNPRPRAAAVAALAALAGPDDTTATIGNPVFLSERNDIEDCIADGVCLPTPFGRPLHTELTRLLDEISPRGSAGPVTATADPEPVIPGSLGHWAEDTG